MSKFWYQYESKRPNLGQSPQNPSEVIGTAAAASIKPTAYDAHEGKLWSNFADAEAASGRKYIQFHSHWQRPKPPGLVTH